MKGKIRLLLIILLLFLLMELFLPIIVERKLEKSVAENVDGYQSLSADAHSFPAWEMIFSKIDRVEVEGRKINVNNLLIEHISANYRNVYLEEEEFKGENKDLEIMISEEAVNNYLTKQYPDFNNFMIKFIDEQVYLRGKINFFKQEIDIQLTGNFIFQGKNILTFQPANLKIEKLEIPGEVIYNYIEDFGFKFNLNNLNIPLNIEQIKIKDSRIYLLGGIFARKAGL